MEAKDLRLDNWVNLRGRGKEKDESFPMQVAQINPDDTIRLWRERETDTTCGCFLVRHIDPIPLTEDWLVKFGFERHESIFIHPNFDHELHLRNDGSFLINHEQMSAFYGTEITYVHQLQNYYHALTRFELLVKQTTEVNQ